MLRFKQQLPRFLMTLLLVGKIQRRRRSSAKFIVFDKTTYNYQSDSSNKPNNALQDTSPNLLLKDLKYNLLFIVVINLERCPYDLLRNWLIFRGHLSCKTIAKSISYYYRMWFRNSPVRLPSI